MDVARMTAMDKVARNREAGKMFFKRTSVERIMVSAKNVFLQSSLFT